jgi:hypothetical protein
MESGTARPARKHFGVIDELSPVCGDKSSVSYTESGAVFQRHGAAEDEKRRCSN